jgi:hypothetical protein
MEISRMTASRMTISKMTSNSITFSRMTLMVHLMLFCISLSTVLQNVTPLSVILLNVTAPGGVKAIAFFFGRLVRDKNIIFTETETIKLFLFDYKTLTTVIQTM